MPYTKSELCQLGWISCIGCCYSMHDTDKLSAAKTIEKNTREWNKHLNEGGTHKEFLAKNNDLKKNQDICKHVIYDSGQDKLFCVLHPEITRPKHPYEKDLRRTHDRCDTMHLCKTAFLFSVWSDERKKEFLQFIKKKKRSKKLDWHSYSKKMADDSLLNEFEGLE